MLEIPKHAEPANTTRTPAYVLFFRAIGMILIGGCVILIPLMMTARAESMEEEGQTKVLDVVVGGGLALAVLLIALPGSKPGTWLFSVVAAFLVWLLVSGVLLAFHHAVGRIRSG